MTSKIFWFDTETTGVDSKKNALIQVAGLIQIDEVIEDEFNILIAPHKDAIITDEALDINGRTKDEIKGFSPLLFGINSLKKMLSKHVDKFDSSDKMVMAGFRVGFDENFLRQAFLRVNDKYFGSWFFNCALDVSSLLAIVVAYNDFRLENYKLTTICERFDIKIEAHDAFSDILATRELYYKLLSIIKEL